MMYKQTGQYVYHTDDQKVGEGVYSPRLMRKFTWMILPDRQQLSPVSSVVTAGRVYFVGLLL